MRRAKQNRSDDVTERAQRMATERSNQQTHDFNSKTGQSITRSLDANREVMREVAMESSVLGRKGKAVEQSPEPVQQIQKQPPAKDMPQYDVNLISRPKNSVQAGHGQDSMPPGFRRALEQNKEQQRSSMKVQAPVRDHQRPNPEFKTAKVKNSAHAKPIAYGLAQNPIEDARRRKKLEAKIRELASK